MGGLQLLLTDGEVCHSANHLLMQSQFGSWRRSALPELLLRTKTGTHPIRRALVWAKTSSSIRKNENHSQASRCARRHARTNAFLHEMQWCVPCPAPLRCRSLPFLWGTASSASLQTRTRYQNETCPNFLNSVITFCFCPTRPWRQLSSCRNGFKQGTGAIFSLKGLLLHPVLSLSEQPQLLPQHPIIPMRHGARAGAGRCPAEREGVSSGKHSSALQ